MKKSILALASLLFLFSCTKDPNPIQVEEVVEGSKWNLEIGSTSAEVYDQLVTLGGEKNFDYIDVYNRPLYDTPEEVEELFPYYDLVGLILAPQQQIQDRIYFFLGENQVDSIYDASTNTLVKLDQWPAEEEFENPILPGDSFEEFYQKLQEIYADEDYSDYKIGVSAKPLNRPFDPNLEDFSQWIFKFDEQINAGVTRQNEVTLSFDEDGNLKLIHLVYQDSKK